MRRVPLTPETFAARALLRGFEGGVVYTAERAGKFYVIQDESTMADLLPDEDLGELKTVLEFDTSAERASYIRERGWDEPRRRR